MFIANQPVNVCWLLGSMNHLPSYTLEYVQKALCPDSKIQTDDTSKTEMLAFEEIMYCASREDADACGN